MHLNGEKCKNVICREQLAGNGQMGLRLMMLKKFGHITKMAAMAINRKHL